MNFGGTGFSFKPKESDLFNEKQSYFKPFKFQEPTEQLNLRLIDNIDVDRIYYSGDISQAQSAIKNFINSKLSTIELASMNYEKYFKIFRMSQMAMEFYSHQQQQKKIKADVLYAQYLDLQEKMEKLSEIKKKHSNEKEKISEKLQKLQAKNSELKEEASKIGSFKCIYCNKTFTQRESLNSHVKRRHEQLLQEITNTNDLFKEQNPLMKVKKLEEDRKRLQEKIHITEMKQLQKIHETKLNEEEVVKDLNKKLSDDLKLKIKVAFENNQEQTKQKQIQAKDDQNKEYIQNTIGEMQDMFQNFEKQFDDFKTKQTNISTNQGIQQKEFEKIEKKQVEYNDIKIKYQNTILEEETKRTEQNFQKIKVQNTQNLVKNYIDNLTESVTSEDFLQIAGVVQKSKRIDNVQHKTQNDGLQIQVFYLKLMHIQHQKADTIQFGPLKDDNESGNESGIYINTGEGKKQFQYNEQDSKNLSEQFEYGEESFEDEN